MPDAATQPARNPVQKTAQIKNKHNTQDSFLPPPVRRSVVPLGPQTSNSSQNQTPAPSPWIPQGRPDVHPAVEKKTERGEMDRQLDKGTDRQTDRDLGV